MRTPRSLTSALRLELEQRQWAWGRRVVYRIPPHLWKRQESSVEVDEKRPVEYLGYDTSDKCRGSWKVLEGKNARMDPVGVKAERRRGGGGRGLIGRVPTLKHGLERVLKQEGVHRTVAGKGAEYGRKDSVGGSGMWVGSIPEMEKVDWERFPKYVPAGRDEVLRKMGEEMVDQGVRFVGSTSSMTSILSALYHLVSNFKDTGLLGGLGTGVSQLPKNFVKSHSKPCAVILTRLAGSKVMSIDSHNGLDKSPSILRDLGHPLERMLTMTPDDFVRSSILEEPLKKTGGSGLSYVEQQGKGDVKQYYNYSKAGKFLIRAQIDCRDADGKHVFDLKSRAVAAIRYDLDRFKENAHVKIERICGAHGSYEREFYDMVRGIFLKYALQLRIGRMSGAFVTYHNTSQILGFEYVSLKEIECYVFGSTRWADIAVGLTTELLGIVFSRASESFSESGNELQGRRIKVVVDSDRSTKEMYIYAQRLPSSHDPLDPYVFEKAMPQEMARKPKRNKVRVALPGLHSRGLKDPKRAHLAFPDNGTDWMSSHNGMIAGITAVGGSGAELIDSSFDIRKALRRARGTKTLCHRSGVPLDWINNPLIERKDLRVWKLKLMQSINGRSTKLPIAIDEDDRFSVRYLMEEVEVHEEHQVKYMGTLKRLYATV